MARLQWKEAEDEYKNGVEIAEERLNKLTKEDQRQRWTKETGDVYRGLAEVFLAEKRNQEAIQLLEFHRYRPFARETIAYAKSSGPRWPEIEKTVLAQPLPPASGTRLVYVSARNHLYIFTIGGESIKIAVLNEKRDDLERRIYRYVQKCSMAQTETAPLPVPDAESKDLFSRLLQPVVAQLRAPETIVIDPDIVMKGLPLEALKSPEGWYFGEKFPIIYSPGYLRENDLRKSSQQAPRWGLLVDALGGAVSEGAKLHDSFPEIQLVDRPDLKPAELRDLLAPSEIFHFVGHGKLGALLLANGTSMKASDFPPESLRHLQVAVLAACSTGLTSEGLGDSSSLVRAFQAGGTPTVIASQWDVDSRATRQLMGRFYTHLRNDEPAVLALFEAKKELIRGQTYKHPYYWASFILSGRA